MNRQSSTQVKTRRRRNLILIATLDAMVASLKSGWYSTQKALCTIKWRRMEDQEEKLMTSKSFSSGPSFHWRSNAFGSVVEPSRVTFGLAAED
jgi:hypothetical protein